MPPTTLTEDLTRLKSLRDDARQNHNTKAGAPAKSIKADRALALAEMVKRKA